MIKDKAKWEAFIYNDWNGDRKMQPDELRFALRTLGIVISEAEVNDFIKAGGGKKNTTFEEFSALVDKYVERQRVVTEPDAYLKIMKDLRTAFDVMDKRKTGKISVAQLRAILTTRGEAITGAEFERIFNSSAAKKANVAEEGLNFEQFYKLLVGKSMYLFR